MPVEIDERSAHWLLWEPATPTWDDLATWHCNSSFHCVPQSLESITAWIALEGGKNGCSALQVQDIINRHTPTNRPHDHVVNNDDDDDDAELRSHSNKRKPRIKSKSKLPSTPHVELDLAVMEYWWNHLRQHPSLTFTHSPTISLNERQDSVQLHDDGVLSFPFDRVEIPFAQLSHSYSICVSHYPTLRITASPELRRTVLGWTRTPNFPFNPTYVGIHTQAKQAHVPEESPALLKAGYCLLETIGKSAWTGIYQAYLHVLLGSGHSLSSLYPAINFLRFQKLITLTAECGRPKVWMSTWRERCVSIRAWREASARQLARWHREHPRGDLPDTSFDDFGENVYCDENLWKMQYTPELLLDMPWVYQIYRIISNAGTVGTTSVEIRSRLGGFGMKTIDSFLSTVAEVFKVKAVADRQGKLFVYRYFTMENFDKKFETGGSATNPTTAPIPVDDSSDAAYAPAKEPLVEVQPAFFQDKKTTHRRSSRTPSSPATPHSRSNTNSTELLASPASASLMDVNADSSPVTETVAPTSATRLGGQRATTLLQSARRQYVLDTLEKADNKMLSCGLLTRQLAESHPPVMTSQTATKFYTMMQTDGLIDVRSFTFSSRSGNKLQPITVARRRALNEQLDAKSDAEIQELMKQVGLTEQRWKFRTGEFKPPRVKSEATENEPDEPADTPAPSTPRTDGGTVVDSALNDASGDDSDVELEDRGFGRQRQRESSAYQRTMFGWIAPPVPRVRWLQHQLFSVYANGPNAVVHRDVDDTLTFVHHELISHMIWRDFLLLHGIEEKIVLEHQEIMDSSNFDKPLNELPKIFHQISEWRSNRYIPFLNVLHLMREMGLVEPYTPINMTYGDYIEKYRLTMSQTVGDIAYDFTQEEDREAYWNNLQDITAFHNRHEESAAFGASFGLSADMSKYLSNSRQWVVRTLVSENERLQLDTFDASSSHPGRPLSVPQILRAATLLGRSIVVLYLYYCRQYYPQLIEVHDKLRALGEKYISYRFKGTRPKSDEKGPKPAPVMRPLMRVRRRPTISSVAKRRKTGRHTSAEVDSAAGTGGHESSEFSQSMVGAGMSDDSSDEEYQDNLNSSGGRLRAERFHYTSDMIQSIIAALRAYLEHHHIDVDDIEDVELPDSAKDHPWLPQIAPLLAAAQFAEITQREQLAQEAQAVRAALIAKKKQEVRLIDIEARKSFVLEGQQLPPPLPVIEIPQRTKEVPDISLKSRLAFIFDRIPPGPSYDQLSAFIDRVRKRLQIRTIRHQFGKTVEYKHVSELLEQEPELAGLFNLLLAAVLQPDNQYDADDAHQSVAAYTDDDVAKVARAMQDDYLVSRKRKNLRGEQRSFHVSGRFHDSLRVAGSVTDVREHARQMFTLMEDMQTAPFGEAWPVQDDTSTSSSWAIIEELMRGDVDFDIEEVRPPPLRNTRFPLLRGGRFQPTLLEEDEDEPSGNQSINQSINHADLTISEERANQLVAAAEEKEEKEAEERMEMEQESGSTSNVPYWNLPSLAPESYVYASNWMSLVDLTALSEVPTRPFISSQSLVDVNQSVDHVGVGLPHHEFRVRFGRSTDFGDAVLSLADEFDQTDMSSSSQSINQPIDDISALAEFNGQQVEQMLQSPEVAALVDVLIEALQSANKLGLTISALLRSINQSTNQSINQSHTSSIDECSAVPIPMLRDDSSLFDYALATLLHTNRAFIAASLDQFLYVHQQYAAHWQIPEFRTQAVFYDEERSWHKELTQRLPICQPINQSINQPIQSSSKSTNQSINQVKSPCYLPSAFIVWPWRSLYGEINVDLHSRMLDSVVSIVSEDGNGVNEDMIRASMRSCTRMQIRALLAHLIGEGRIQEVVQFETEEEQSINQSNNQSTNQPINQSTNQSNNQSTSQSFSQSTSQPIKRVLYRPSRTVACYWLVEKQPA